MAGNTNTQYLESRILTASQPRLHLMLLEAAWRQCAVARQAGGQQFWGEYDAALDKTMGVAEELVRSVAGKQSEISASLEEQYAFLFRELAHCRITQDLAKLDACTKLLEVHRETWKQACEKLEAPQAARPPLGPHLLHDVAAGESFSLEA